MEAMLIVMCVITFQYVFVIEDLMEIPFINAIELKVSLKHKIIFLE